MDAEVRRAACEDGNATGGMEVEAAALYSLRRPPEPPPRYHTDANALMRPGALLSGAQERPALEPPKTSPSTFGLPSYPLKAGESILNVSAPCVTAVGASPFTLISNADEQPSGPARFYRAGEWRGAYAPAEWGRKIVIII